MESNADLQDVVDKLQSKADDIQNSLMGEHFLLKVQRESHSSQHSEDEARIQELLEKKAQMEVGQLKCLDELDKVKSQLIHLKSEGSPGSASTFSPPRISQYEMTTPFKMRCKSKEKEEMKKTMETLKLVQAKYLEQEEVNKRLTDQTHSYLKDILKLKEDLHRCKAKCEKMEKLHVDKMRLKLQQEDADAAKMEITELKILNALFFETILVLERDVCILVAKQ